MEGLGNSDEIKISRKEKGVTALTLALLLSLTFTGALKLRAPICETNANTTNVACLGVNLFLLFHTPFAEIQIKNTLGFFFPKDEE